MISGCCVWIRFLHQINHKTNRKNILEKCVKRVSTWESEVERQKKCVKGVSTWESEVERQKMFSCFSPSVRGERTGVVSSVTGCGVSKDRTVCASREGTGMVLDSRARG